MAGPLFVDVVIQLMDRRTFFEAVASSLLVATFAAHGQQPPIRIYRIGFLGAESVPYDARRLQILRTRLRELGYMEGTVVIESRFAEGNYGRLPALAAELVGLKVDVLVASGSKAGVAASRATATIPIVVSNMGDAINQGFVGNYAQPVGNVTGMSQLNPEAATKLVELLKQVKPRSATVAVLVNPANPNSAMVLETQRRAAEAMKVTLKPIEVHGPGELTSAFSTLGERGIDALLVQSETMFSAHANAIADLALKYRIASAGTIDFAHAGGLIGYSTNRLEAFRDLIGYVDKILKGAKPADLPVEQPSKVVLVINLKTAKALRLTIPQALLLRADEVIQ
jgi:putative tryptophan/tyrosine transport system substrate-binding protein